MSKTYIEIGKLIEALQDISHEELESKLSEPNKSKNMSTNEQLSVQIGLERKRQLKNIANEKDMSLSELTRSILDKYIFRYFENEENKQIGKYEGCLLAKRGYEWY